MPWASRGRWNRWPPSSLGNEGYGHGTTTILFQGGAPMLHIAICDDDPAALRDAIALITLEDGKTYTIQTSSRL